MDDMAAISEMLEPTMYILGLWMEQFSQQQTDLVTGVLGQQSDILAGVNAPNVG